MTRRFQVTFDVEVDIDERYYQDWTAEKFVSVFGDITFGTSGAATRVNRVTVEEKAVE